MKRRKFGHTGLKVSALCLSTSNFARYADQDESFAILDAFREAGGNLIQTSGICPGVSLGDGFLGMPEEFVGRWFDLRSVARQSTIVATRIALTRPVIGGVETYTDLIRSCVEDSVRRMNCDFLDLLVIEWTEAIAPVAETMAAFEALVAAGLVKHVVPANFPSWLLLEALSVSGRGPRTMAGVQLDYSLVTRCALEGSVGKVCADHGLAVIARSALAGGHLATRATARTTGTLRQRALIDRPGEIAAEGMWPLLSAIARRRNQTPAQVALAWALSQDRVTSVLISVRSLAQLRELIDATRLDLSDADRVQLGGTNRTPLRGRSSGGEQLSRRCTMARGFTARSHACGRPDVFAAAERDWPEAFAGWKSALHG